MGLFGRLERPLTLPATDEEELYSWKPPHITALAKTKDGRTTLQLVHEHGNESDDNAVQAHNEHGPLGYLSRTSARQLVRVISSVTVPVLVQALIQTVDNERQVIVGIPDTRTLRTWKKQHHLG